jgi:polyferredoxin
LSAPAWLRSRGHLVAIVLFLAVVSNRKVVLERDGPALAQVLLAVIGTAFAGGLLFNGKSGWCSSICPCSLSSASTAGPRSSPSPTATASPASAAVR